MESRGNRVCSLCRENCPKNHLGGYFEEGPELRVPIILRGRYATMAKVQLNQRESMIQSWLATLLGLRGGKGKTYHGRIGSRTVEWLDQIGVSVPTSKGLVEHITFTITDALLEADVVLGADAIASNFCLLLLPRSVCCLIHRSTLAGLQQDEEKRRNGSIDAAHLPPVWSVDHPGRRSAVIDITRTSTHSIRDSTARGAPIEFVELREGGVRVRGLASEARESDPMDIVMKTGADAKPDNNWTLRGRVVTPTGPGADVGVVLDRGNQSPDHEAYARWLKELYLARLCLL